MGGKMIKKNIFIVRLCIVMFLIFLPVALPADLSAQADVTAPVLVGLSFTPTTIDVSGGNQDVVFTWTLMDDTGIGDGYTYLEIISPSDQTYWTFVYLSDITDGNMNYGVFKTIITLPQYSETGTWKIQYVFLRDELDNAQYLYTSDLVYLGFNTDLIVSIAPTADAGPEQTIDEGATVTLDASNSSSSDSDDWIASYLWEQTDGTSVILSDCASDQPTFTAPDVGPDEESLTFHLTVTDNEGLQAQDTCIVNVSWLNIAPTAVAGSDQTVNDGVTVTLDASNSSDPDDGIASYLWDQTSGTTVTLSDETVAQPTFTAPDVGLGAEALTFQLTVTDNEGLQAQDTCIVNVSWLNIAPTAVAGSDQTVGEGVIVTLDASNSTDPDDGIASYLWEQTGGSPTVTLTVADTAEASFTAPDVGPDGESLTFQLTVTDNGGLQAQDTCIVSVLNNTPPDIPTAVSPANELIFAEGPVTLKTSPFSDPDGDTHLQTHWLVKRADSVYYRSDYDPSFDQLMTAVSLTEHTVSGLEPGLKYVWKAGYVDSGSGDTSWSQEYTFKIGTSQVDSSVWIEPGTEAPDFKMVSFIQWPDDPASTSVFGDEMGESYGQDFRMGTYDPTSSSGGYVEYGSNLIIEPGRAYWFLARDGLDITVNGVPVSEIHNIELGLLYNASNENGWNMIACPNNADYCWADVEVVEYDDKGNILYGPTAISELGDPNDYIDKRLWAWENGAYYSDTFLKMKKHEGYWVKVKKANVFLRFPVSAQAGLSNLSTQVAIPDPDDSPPAPIGDFSVSQGGAGGDVGCFIATAAYGSPMEGHVKTLKDSQNSYLLPYSILNHGPTITAIMLVFTLVFPVSFVSSYRRKMKG